MGGALWAGEHCGGECWAARGAEDGGRRRKGNPDRAPPERVASSSACRRSGDAAGWLVNGKHFRDGAAEDDGAAAASVVSQSGARVPSGTRCAADCPIGCAARPPISEPNPPTPRRLRCPLLLVLAAVAVAAVVYDRRSAVDAVDRSSHELAKCAPPPAAVAPRPRRLPHAARCAPPHAAPPPLPRRAGPTPACARATWRRRRASRTATARPSRGRGRARARRPRPRKRRWRPPRRRRRR